MKKKLILYELNEVPRKLLEHYIKERPHSALAKLVSEGYLFDTLTNDEGELHPWSTWPSLHRGVYNDKHGIKYINQDLTCANEFKPIWQILSENGKDVGVFGSLQSYPPVLNQFVKFYLPDTFAPDFNSFPDEIEEFQKFNLLMTGENKAASRSISSKSFLIFMKLLMRRIISTNSAFIAIFQIFKEKLNKKFKSRRSIIQCVISFDLYFKYLKRYKPSFSTYFTNHVAGMMHRYWKDLFIEEFDSERFAKDKFHSKSVIRAMDVADKNLNKLINFADKEKYDLWVLTSMGQSSIDRGEYIDDLYLSDISKLLKNIKLNPKDFQLLPAMHPDNCVICKDKKSLSKLRNSLANLKDTRNNPLVIERYPPTGLTLNIQFKKNKTIAQNKTIVFDEQEFNILDFGLEIIKRDIGTGYHIPEGIFIAYGSNSQRFKSIQSRFIETTKFAPTILKFFNIKPPSYMRNCL